ncbi:MAG TPA: hypothetical protein VFH38_10400 [Jatrophihabitans sp.]|nr:hypothetical protein [Jatrophihabitans sp.]
MRKILFVATAAAMALAMFSGTAQAAGHQFRGHIATTAVPGPTITIDGRGHVSGLGDTTMTGVQTADPTTGALTGSGTFTAANGADITFAWSDIPVGGTPPVITFAGSMRVIGGTGRLADRCGTVGFTGGFDFRTNTGYFDVSGALETC